MIKQALAGLALTGTLALAVPAAPALADGAASTRNLLLLGGAATYLIIQHNRKVHQRYDEDARRQSALEQENSQSESAYDQAHNAYEQQLSENQQLRHEVAYQHSIIVNQQRQLASVGVHQNFVGAAPSRARTTVARTAVANPQVAEVSYGWGTI